MGTTALAINLVTQIYNKPPTPPSASAETAPAPFMVSFKTMLANTEFRKLIIFYAMMNA